jgi:hypothetical protein
VQLNIGKMVAQALACETPSSGTGPGVCTLWGLAFSLPPGFARRGTASAVLYRRPLRPGFSRCTVLPVAICPVRVGGTAQAVPSSFYIFVQLGWARWWHRL